MRNATPSLNAIRAFEAAARHESFAKSAQELGVSASAVSQQVSQLESDLGIRLFERIKQRLRLTEAGRTYQDSLSSALDRIETATTDLVSNKGVQQLRVGSLPSLASYWLIPRLLSFVQQHPKVKLHVVTLEVDFAAPERSPNLQGGRIDVGLFYGDGHWSGLKSEKFMDEYLVPVASRRLVEQFKGQEKGSDLDADELIGSLPLMQHSTRPHSWQEWFQSRNQEARFPDGPSFEHFHMLVDAAKAGIGVALVPSSFVSSELKHDRLVRLGENELKSERAYYVVSNPHDNLSQSRVMFTRWLHQQVDNNPTQGPA
jgi:DNA-binding transcriptional LysR family regulator